MKKVLLTFCLLVSTFMLTGCKNEGIKFKQNYESLNGKENKYGGTYRSVTIPENNPFVYTTATDIIEKIENNETFYVYFGDELCPWCRSVIEKASVIAMNSHINKIYYVDIWNENGEETLRDKITLNEDGTLNKINEGTDEYKKLLEYFNEVLEEYNLTDNKGEKVNTNEKRIYAPNFIYVSSGKAVKMIEGVSSKQENANDELTNEILQDEEGIFKEFFNLNKVCTEKDKC